MLQSMEQVVKIKMMVNQLFHEFAYNMFWKKLFLHSPIGIICPSWKHFLAQDSCSDASLGGPSDLEELESTTSPGSSSDLVSDASTASSDRLGRIIQQLQHLKLVGVAKQQPLETVESVVVDSSDDEGSSGESRGPTGEVSTSTESRTERIVELLKATKEKQLMMSQGKHADSPTPLTSTNKKAETANPYVMPSHVSLDWYME